MASTIKVDKLDPQSGTALEIGTSGDTVTVPSGVGLTLTDSTLLLPTTITSTTEVKTNKISPATGVAFALGDSGDTFTVPSGATIVNSGTATGFGGGKILQIQSVFKSDTFSASSASWTDITDMTVDITCSATSSKVLIISNVGVYGQDAYTAHRLMRDSTPISVGDTAGSRTSCSAGFRLADSNASSGGSIIMYLDSPSSTSALTYKLQMYNDGGGTGYINRQFNDLDNDGYQRGASSIQLLEIDGS
jgi:hypothetical protein